jgi:hypothetical protein
MGAACSTYERTEKQINKFVRRPGGKRRLEGTGRRQNNNIRLVQKTIFENVDWIHLTQD